MADDWDFDFLPPGLGYTDLDLKQMVEDQVRAVLFMVARRDVHTPL